MVKKSHANEDKKKRDADSMPESRSSPGGGHSKAPKYSCLENPMYRERSLADYSSQGHKESDTIEAT